MIRCIKGLIFFQTIIFAFASWAGTVTQTKPPGYAVASAHPLATEAGLKILAEGGNAFDAAVAVSAVMGVVAPYHSGLGGGSYWLLYQEKDQQYDFIDGREVAPKAATKTMYQDENGQVIPKLSLDGALSAAIPGHPAALVYVARTYGRLPLSQSLQPAIELAEKGFPLDDQFYAFFQMSDRLEQLKKFNGSRAVFTKNGESFLPGEQIIQPDLARTLRKLAQEGKKGFYEGETAKKLVDGVRKEGGIWTLDDLKHYQIKRRRPIVGQYHQMRIITAPPSSAGGVALLTMLNILSHYSLESIPRIERIHYIIEAMRMAFWQRDEFLGDPDFVTIPLSQLLSMNNAGFLKKKIFKDKATNSKLLDASGEALPTKRHTTHISIIDSQGNRVALTQTVNFIFGSSLVPEGTGVLLNDEMDDFSMKTGVKNVFGIVGSEANSIEAGKRPLSSMAPTFLELPERIAIVGTPGGSRIPTMVLLAALEFYHSHGAISMVSAMRFHHQYLPDLVQFEPETFSEKTQEALIAMGYRLKPLKQYYGDMQAISWDQKNHILTAASDPRHIGLAISRTVTETGYGLNH